MTGNCERELRAVLNRHSVENQSDTPDIVLSIYISAVLDAFSVAVRQRDHWHGFKPFEKDR